MDIVDRFFLVIILTALCVSLFGLILMMIGATLMLAGVFLAR